MQRGKRTVIPGFINKLSCFGVRLVPRRFASWMARRVLGKPRARRPARTHDEHHGECSMTRERQPPALGSTARGVYEVWYLTWNHPQTGQGFWLRYITEAPTPARRRAAYGEAPRGELWFARFDPQRPERTFGIHKRFRADRADREAPFALTIGGAQLGHDHAVGELAGGGHDVRWDLRWEPAAQTLRQLPDVMYARGGLGETTVHVAEPARAAVGHARSSTARR